MVSCVSHTLCMKAIVGLSPGALLSYSSRKECIANINRLPSASIRGERTKHSASVFVPVCVENGEVCLLYTLRAHSYNRFNCLVTFPGGKLEENENVCDAAIRETEDDLGIHAKDIQVWTKMGQVQLRKAKLIVTPVVGEILNFNMQKLIPNQEEVDDVFTIPMNVFCDKNNHGSLRHNGVLVPVFSGGKYKVWGITATITHRFLYTFLPKDLYSVGFFNKEYTIDELNE
uniref:Nudix hydrolase domain-containing protein n=1 Tax=Heliothis virescens TaxID=7102 RepID=A0A2A4K0G7_HELVI